MAKSLLWPTTLHKPWCIYTAHQVQGDYIHNTLLVLGIWASKNRQFCVFETNPKHIHQLRLFKKNLKEPPDFMKEPVVFRVIFWPLNLKKEKEKEKQSYISEPSILILLITMVIYIRPSILIFKNHGHMD